MAVQQFAVENWSSTSSRLFPTTHKASFASRLLNYILAKNKMATRTSLATDFPLRNPRNRPGKTVLLHICGFAMTVDDLLHWADTHHIEPNAPFFKRLDVTRRVILDRLPWKVEGPYACLFVDHETEKLSDGLPRPATCFFVGTNGSQKALDQAKNEDLIRGFQEVLDTQEKPRWYRPGPF
ncbi:hypothetical protein ARMSODRAFT_57464 [Armillaria solidipes]|uniref:Uncharacterized protein n=1 Tax=Armillaria solidipes TaxID=1076256 RepID=A0A2H3CI22_9AGAR|nr:hypothetical protein ARMSODRAFT_57464 [Armillaria solidipes]